MFANLCLLDHDLLKTKLFELFYMYM